MRLADFFRSRNAKYQNRTKVLLQTLPDNASLLVLDEKDRDFCLSFLKSIGRSGSINIIMIRDVPV